MWLAQAGEANSLGSFEAYLWAALGVALSVLIPVVAKAVKDALPQGGAADAATPNVRDFAKPYLLVAVMSLLIAVLIIAFAEFKDWRAAVIGGYAWDATLQKIRRGATS